MPRKEDKTLIKLTIFLIVLTFIMVVWIILDSVGLFDRAEISLTGHLIGSDLLTKNQPEFGLQFRNDGKIGGEVMVKASSDNKDISILEDEIIKWVPPTKTALDFVNFEFKLDKSSFKKQINNFTINLDVYYEGKKAYPLGWKYFKDCFLGQTIDCPYRWKK